MSTETPSAINLDIPKPILESYKKAMQENSSLLEQLFGVGCTVSLEATGAAENSGETGGLKQIFHFLDVYNDIFDYSAKPQLKEPLTNPVITGNSQVLQQCNKKFRDIWRQEFRGFQYMPEQKLEKALKRAELETLLKLSSFQDKSFETQVTLKEYMLLEHTWIKRINEHKRNKDLEVIQNEAVDKFTIAAAAEFPYLFDEEDNGKGKQFLYYEDDFFDWKLGEIIETCKNGFRTDIPFQNEEQDEVIRKYLNNLGAKLDEKVVKDLKSRNASKKIAIREFMDSLVDKCVEKYKDSITTAVLGEDETSAQVQIETETILQLHNGFLEESTPKFGVPETEIEIGTEEYQVKCLNTFNDKTYQIFKTWVENLHKNCQENMTTCQQQTKEEIKICLEKMNEISGQFKGMSSYSNILRSHFENGLGIVFGHVKDVNQNTKQLLLTATKPTQILTNAEIEYKQLMEKCKKTYADNLSLALQKSLKCPSSLDNILLDQCHQEAKSAAIKLISSTSHNVPYLSLKLESKFVAYVLHFITQAKANMNGFTERISGLWDTFIPFKAVPGTDFLLKNGAVKHVNTRHQCITVMKEYKDKSLEELRFENISNNILLISENISELLEEAVSYFDIHENFEKSLNFSGPGFGLTDKSFQFSAPLLLSQGHLSFTQTQPSEFDFGTYSSENASTEPRRVNKFDKRFRK